MPGSVAIVLALDDRFVPPAQVMIESIRRHGGRLDGVNLVVLTQGLTALSTRALENSASRAGLSFTIRTVGNTTELGSIPDWAVPSCLRLYAGDFCQDFERALYLDSDMLVLSDLSPIFDFDMGDATAAAVINYPPFDVIRVAIRRSQRGEVDGDAPYFNAGVLLVDTQRWEARSVGRQSRAFLRRHPTTRLLDQDALNMVLVKDWCALDRKWNTPAGELETAPIFRGLLRLSPTLSETLRQWGRAQAQPRILHFTGAPKPWEESYPWPELKQRYYEFVLNEFGVAWPASRPTAITDSEGVERVREFRRT
jgi:lipopolysaccharide biosynthesis glycosyltransferase